LPACDSAISFAAGNDEISGSGMAREGRDCGQRQAEAEREKDIAAAR